MKTYSMIRDPDSGEALAYVNGQKLPPCHDIRNHSPDGFNWGYAGSGPAQLALALVYDALGGKAHLAELYYQEFKRAVLALEKRNLWFLTDEWIQGWLCCYEQMSYQIRALEGRGDADA